MNAVTLPLRFQVGARTIASIHRELVRIPLSLDDALAGRLPVLPALPDRADGYAVTSLPTDRCDTLICATGAMLGLVRQRYTRQWTDLTIGFAAYLAQMSGNTRASFKRKARKLAAAAGGALDVRRFSSPEEMERFHNIARQISQRTYQERLLGEGMPTDACFVQRMFADAAAGLARGWLIYIGDVPAAYLYCPIHSGTVIYDRVGHDPAFSDLSPGGVLQLEAMRDLFADPAATRFDFTEGDGQHKRQFATGGVACVDLLLLRPTLANRATIAALGSFDRGVAIGKRAVAVAGFERAARRIRR